MTRLVKVAAGTAAAVLLATIAWNLADMHGLERDRARPDGWRTS